MIARSLKRTRNFSFTAYELILFNGETNEVIFPSGMVLNVDSPWKSFTNRPINVEEAMQRYYFRFNHPISVKNSSFSSFL